MQNNNGNNIGSLARDIQRRLAEAQGSSAAPAASGAQPAPGALRITKDGQLLSPSEEAPRDANGNPVATSSIPDATFHGPVSS